MKLNRIGKPVVAGGLGVGLLVGAVAASGASGAGSAATAHPG